MTKPYPAYEPATSPWLDQYPIGWRQTRFRYEATINGGQVDPRDSPWSAMTLVAPNHIESGTGRILASETAVEQGADSGKYTVTAGQVMYSKIRPALNKVAIATEDCLCSADMYAMSFKDQIDVEFAAYSMLARPFHTFATVTSMRVKMPKINREDLGDAPWLVPPLAEQRAIADYLDCETARIDTLIAEQQRLIEMLRERRQTQVDHAVWSGLDGAPRTPTPVEPAPDVPAHWRVLRNKNLLSESTTVSADGSEELLSVSHLTGITPRSDKNVTMTEAETLDGYRLVERGDLVINTMWAWMGALGVSRVEGIVSPAYGVYRPLQGAEFHPPYFDYLYRSRPYVVEMTRFSRGIWSSRLRIYPEVFLRLHVVVPPLDEQRRIAAYLDERTAKIDTLIAETERFIELARERRSALITSAVTGQIDVREVA